MIQKFGTGVHTAALFFKLITDEASLWVKWTREYSLINKHLWTMKEPVECSWVMRGILKNRKHARNLIKYIIMDGMETYFWHDLWCGSAPLLEDQMAIQSINLPLNAKVTELIETGNWSETVLNFPNQIRDIILSTNIEGELDKDFIS